MEATTALEHPRIARIMLLVGVIALVALLFSMDPVAAWPTTNMPTSGGSSTYWYEASSSDPLVILG